MRCFLAVELPESVRERLRSLQDRLQSVIRGVRWGRPDQIHLTIKFLGDVPDARLSAVCRVAELVASACPQCDITVGGTGCFPPRGPVRIIWAGLVDPPQTLFDCQRRCERDFMPLGYPPEERRFHPHLTLGRVNASPFPGDVRGAVGREAGFSCETFTARELVVFESILSSAGPTYTAICRVPFVTT